MPSSSPTIVVVGSNHEYAPVEIRAAEGQLLQAGDTVLVLRAPQLELEWHEAAAAVLTRLAGRQRRPHGQPRGVQQRDAVAQPRSRGSAGLPSRLAGRGADVAPGAVVGGGVVRPRRGGVLQRRRRRVPLMRIRRRSGACAKFQLARGFGRICHFHFFDFFC